MLALLDRVCLCRDFGVTAMPGPKGTKLRVGILADWGCGTAESAAVLEALRAEQPDVLIHLVCLFRQILDYALGFWCFT